MGVNPQAQAALDALFGAWGQPLNVISGYRDPAHNARVGGARNSQHTHGNAFDLDVSGLSHAQRLQLAEKARAAGFSGFGFYDNSMHFDVGPSRYWGPSYGAESTPDWAMPFVQTAFGQGAAGGGAGGGVMATKSPPAGLLAGAIEEPRRPSIWDKLGPLADPDRRARLAIGLEGMTLNPNQALIGSLQEDVKGRRADKTRNATAQWLAANGRQDLAEAMMAGALQGSEAMSLFYQKGDDGQTALIKNYEYAKANGFAGSFGDFMASGGGGGTVINNGDVIKELSNGSLVVRDPNAPDGYRIVNPPGGEVDRAAAAEADRAAGAEALEQKYLSPALDAIDQLIDPETGMLQRNGMLDILPDTGVHAERLDKWGLNQEARTIRKTLETIQSNIAFTRLQEMREASKTGGALGAVTERELSFLMSTLGAITADVDTPTLKSNLKKVRDILAKIESDPVASAFYYGGGLGAAPPAPGAGGTGGLTLKGTR